MIMKFPDELQQLLEKHNQKTKMTEAQIQEFDEELTKRIDAQQHKLGSKNAVVTMVVNKDFKDSYLITAP